MNSSSDFAATIGLDWADQKHDLWLRPADGSKAEHIQLEQTPQALHEWVAKMRQRFANRRIAIAVETSRGPIISALMAYDFIVLVPVNPKALKSFREAFAVSGAKDDRTDAQLLEEMLRLHPEKLRVLEPDTELTRRLAGLTEYRRRLVDERTRLINQLHAALKTYYPLAEELLQGQMNTPMAAEFLLRWPQLEALQRAQPQHLRSFFYKHNSRNGKTIEQRLEALAKAKALTTDTAIVWPTGQLVLALAGMLRPLHQAIGRLERLIEQAMDEHPDAPIFRSFPGAGPALAPRLLVAFGTQRDRFEHSDQVAQFYGIAPVVVQSGNSKTVHMRQRCPKFGRQTFHENASCARHKEAWAQCYYDLHKQGNQPKHHQACRALAYKLIRIYFACWKERTPYSSIHYLAALQRHASPLRKLLENPSVTSS